MQTEIWMQLLLRCECVQCTTPFSYIWMHQVTPRASDKFRNTFHSFTCKQLCQTIYVNMYSPNVEFKLTNWIHLNGECDSKAGGLRFHLNRRPLNAVICVRRVLTDSCKHFASQILCVSVREHFSINCLQSTQLSTQREYKVVFWLLTK